MTGKLADQFAKYNCCVLIPTYNNAATLASVLESVYSYTDRVIVVNDGSTDDTANILEKFPRLKIVTLPVNRGKGMALRKGFEAAVEMGYDKAITIDSDGQHFASDLPLFFERLQENPDAIIVGARNMSGENVPGKSNFGYAISNFWFRFETGFHLGDTQSGYRLYPIRQLDSMKFYTTKYEFEVEVLVRAAWSGIPIYSVPVQVYYAPGKERITHFRPFRDFTRVSILHTLLVILTVVWFFPLRFFNRIKKKTFVQFSGKLLPVRVNQMQGKPLP